MMSLQGRAKGVIECWQTSAVKLPGRQYGIIQNNTESQALKLRSADIKQKIYSKRTVDTPGGT